MTRHRDAFLDSCIAAAERAEAERNAADVGSVPIATWVDGWPYGTSPLGYSLPFQDEHVLAAVRAARWIWLEERGARAACIGDARFRASERQARSTLRRWQNVAARCMARHQEAIDAFAAASGMTRAEAAKRAKRVKAETP